VGPTLGEIVFFGHMSNSGADNGLDKILRSLIILELKESNSEL
jgi:hypothetical protein